MTGQMNNIWDKVALIILYTKVYLIAVAMMYIMPSMIFFLVHYTLVCCSVYCFWRQIEIHAIAKEKFPLSI